MFATKNSYRFILIIAVLILSTLACQTVMGPPATITANTPPTEAPAEGIVEAEAEPIVPAETAPSSLPAVDPEDLATQEETLVEIYDRVSPGVVSIRILSELGGGQGSGFVIDKEGHIVTNNHVIENASELEVAFPNGYKTRATVLGTDLDSDLAVIKVNAPPEQLFPVTLGDSESIRVGQTVVAIGNPFGLNGTMTIGIVSALGRTLDSQRQSPSGGGFFTAGDLIQTDAAINPGNSGGPLLNLRGEVIGVNRAIRTLNFNEEQSPLNSGIGFAISINIVKRVAPALIQNGVYDYPFVGVSSLPEITLFAQEQFDIPQTTGAFITAISPSSPAQAAGVQVGDLITAIDDQEVIVFGDLLSYLINYKSPGDTVQLTILRDGETIELPLVLAERP